jgi:hypothetical protein
MNVVAPLPHALAIPSPDLPQQTALSHAFAMLLPILSDNVRAERDLESVGYSWDLACAKWFEEAERAQDRLIDVLHHLRTLPVERPEDIPLRRIAQYLHAMRGSSADVARNIHQRMERHFEAQFILPGKSLTAQHRNLLMQWSRPIIAAFVALPLFDSDADDEDAPDHEAGLTDYLL